MSNIVWPTLANQSKELGLIIIWPWCNLPKRFAHSSSLPIQFGHLISFSSTVGRKEAGRPQKRKTQEPKRRSKVKETERKENERKRKKSIGMNCQSPTATATGRSTANRERRSPRMCD